MVLGHTERYPSFGRGALGFRLYLAEGLMNDGMGTDGRCPETKLGRITADTRASAESGREPASRLFSFVSGNPSRLGNLYLAENDLECLIFLPPHPEYWDYR